ncbi:MAG: hypothetical protein PSV18_13605 [Methylobacter sp.]|uniref:Uncharacterized protein n=1 Tax=Candidatus Methylobacter titanis TaxID=3053457 RepID=A0AA43Q5Z5_9GAMM|nr:hypothetical protein [Candidatus Methylobacter titanis]MDI1293765.1 hypothetical protein [Candidatus Methylobacter titanis]
MAVTIAMAMAIDIAAMAIVNEGIIKPTPQLPAAELLMHPSKIDRHKKTGGPFGESAGS